MNRRKLAYLLAIVLLLVPLAQLSQPSTSQSPGGMLARMRSQYKLNQADLGQIDAAGETLKLATFGLRVVATSLLWNQANHHMIHEDWTSLAAVLTQLTRLEPNVVSFWHYQGWNVSYNVSVEFEDLRDQYFWIMKGVRFLQDGAARNVNEPGLRWDIGWFVSQKIGKADNRKWYRQFFREDDDFHGPRPRQLRDNWLVGREFFLDAQSVVDRVGFTIKGVSRLGDPNPRINPLLFHSDPSFCLIHHAQTIETEGTFGEPARKAWTAARDDWERYARRDIMTVDNLPIRLADEEQFRKQAQDALAQLESLVPPDTRGELARRKMATLSQAEREALELAPELRNEQQHQLATAAESKTAVTNAEVAAQAPQEKRAQALAAAQTATQAVEMADRIDRNRFVVNFESWRVRTAAEATDNAVRAREACYKAKLEHAAARLAVARKFYDEGFAQWRLVIDKFPNLLEEATGVTDDLSEWLADYEELLSQLDEPFPQPFILQDAIDEIRARQPAAGDVQTVE
jgi:hypothetical protein